MKCVAGAGLDMSRHLRDKNSDSIPDLVDCWGDLQLTPIESRISYKLLGKQTNKSQGFEVKYFLLDYLTEVLHGRNLLKLSGTHMLKVDITWNFHSSMR